MTSRSMLVVWASALLIVVAVLATVLDTLERRPYTRHPRPPSVAVDLTDIEIVAIGSSYTFRAFPMNPIPAGLLGDDRNHRLLVSPGQTAEQSLYLFRLAIEAGADTILLEANDFLFDSIAPDPDPIRSPDQWIAEFFRAVTLGLRTERQHRDHPGGLVLSTTDTIDVHDRIMRNRFQDAPPLRVKYLTEVSREFSALVANARARGVEIVLVLPPVASSFDSALEGTTYAAMTGHAEAFAARTGLPIWVPQDAWPDDHFMDRRHVNRRGRARILSEIADWYAGAR